MASKKKEKKILVLDAQDNGYNWLFSQYGTVDNAHYTGGKKFLIEHLKQYRFIVFTGGSDVSPHLYGETEHETTLCNKQRDTYELAIAKKAIRAGIPLIGICRGAQLGCVVSGAKLDQNKTGHTGNTTNRHSAFIDVGYSPYCYFDVSSDHHQCMQAWRSQKNEKQGSIKYTCVVRAHDQSNEVVWFPDTNWLCVQYHPEWHNPNDLAVQVFNACINDYVIKSSTDAVGGLATRVKGVAACAGAANSTTYNEPAKAVVYASPLTLLGSKNNE